MGGQCEVEDEIGCWDQFEGMCVCVCVCQRRRERVCVLMCSGCIFLESSLTTGCGHLKDLCVCVYLCLCACVFPARQGTRKAVPVLAGAETLYQGSVAHCGPSSFGHTDKHTHTHIQMDPH